MRTTNRAKLQLIQLHLRSDQGPGGRHQGCADEDRHDLPPVARHQRQPVSCAPPQRTYILAALGRFFNHRLKIS